MSKMLSILDHTGKPFSQRPSARADMGEAANRQRGRMRGTYDAASGQADMANHWVNADSYDADSANSRHVRSTLVPRSRYEIGNNGFAAGIARTYATDLVGTGPALQMQTRSDTFNAMVESEWFAWTQAVSFRRKLWCSAHAKHSDGETIGVIRRNPRVRHSVPLDWVIYETEQCQTPYLPYEERGYIDGIKFDEFGNAEWYDILREHPGSGNGYRMEAEQVAAEFVTHWFTMLRPGQHRGVPDVAPTMNLGATARRWREATLTHAEMIAKITVLLETTQLPDGMEPEPPESMSTTELMKGMMTALPDSVKPYQLDPKQPAQTFEMFNRALINEYARPISMPFNKAACDSSSYNYASGRLDHQTYYGHLDVDRADCEELVCDRIFAKWFGWAVRKNGWLGGDPDALSFYASAHSWNWPKHKAVDIEAEADANTTKLETGQASLWEIAADEGSDFDDRVKQMARDYGVKPKEIRRRLLDRHLPEAKQPAAPAATSIDEQVAAALKVLLRRGALNGALNGN